MANSRRIPAYIHHKGSGQALVRINGKTHYLGKYGTPESHERYDDLIAEYLDSAPVTSKTLTAVLAAWWAECKRRYVAGKGKYGGAGSWRIIIRLLREHHGDERAEDLGPVNLRKLIEAEAAKRDWSLSYARDVLAKVKRIYKWAVSEELVGESAYNRLLTCEIRKGSVARTSKPIPPVADSVVDETLPHVNPVVTAMLRFQRLTGMRPGELVVMHRDGIDRSGDVWIYTPEHHKTEHHGKSRTIYIGPKAQAILLRWLLKLGESGYIFINRSGKPYNSDGYRQVVQRAVKRINAQRQKEDPNAELLPMWAPNQVRKAAATEIRAAFDVESAAAILGHSSPTVTGEHYAAADRRRAIEAARKLG